MISFRRAIADALAVTEIKNARDVGANMVIAKPMSPTHLYDRLAWIAFNPRRFVDAEAYFGPDRRFKNEGYLNGVGRRADDQLVEIDEERGPAMSDYGSSNRNNIAHGSD